MILWILSSSSDCGAVNKKNNLTVDVMAVETQTMVIAQAMLEEIVCINNNECKEDGSLISSQST